MSRSIGVLGGAFNPPHVGHLVLAQEALCELGLDEVLLVPTGEAPHKRIDPEPGRDVRLELARRAVEGSEGLRVSDVEATRDGPSYSFRTLELLRDERPGDRMTLIMGADVAAGLETWRRPERVLELAKVAVAERPGFDADALEALLGRLGGKGDWERVSMPEIAVSSTLIRERIAAGRPIRWLVPDGVERLIAERGLYREGSPAS